MVLSLQSIGKKRVSELSPREKEVLKKWFQSTRSRRSIAMDVRRRARIPVHVSTWIAKPNKYDIPGVDEPANTYETITIEVRSINEGYHRIKVTPEKYLGEIEDILRKILREYLGENYTRIYSSSYDKEIKISATPTLLKLLIDILPKILGNKYHVVVRQDKNFKKLVDEWFNRVRDAKETYERRKQVIEKILRGEIPWSKKTPEHLKEIGKLIIKAQKRIKEIIREASKKIYGLDKPRCEGNCRIVVVDTDNKKLYSVVRSYTGEYSVNETKLDNNSWILSHMKISKAFTAFGKPIYVKGIKVLHDFLSGTLNEGTYTLFHEALHKTGSIHGPSRKLGIHNILWKEGGNELITWRYLIEYFKDPGKVGELMKKESPYLWEAFTVSAVAKALGYNNVWDFIRDVNNGKVTESDMEKAIEMKLMKYLSRAYDREIPEEIKKIYIPNKRKWLRKIREEIYDRSDIIASLEYIPTYALQLMYKYAYDVLVNSFPKEFVDNLKP